MKPNAAQDLARFRVPAGFRGRSTGMVQLWWIVQASLFRWSPQFAYGWRRALLRAFGATVGRGVLVRPTATITYPWKLTLGERCWIGDEVVLYSLGRIDIGADSVVSQRSYVCAADHDHTDPAFPIRQRPIRIGSEAWICTDVFVGPGTTIGDRCVIGARSSVFKDQPEGMLCIGTPCAPVRSRVGPTAADSALS